MEPASEGRLELRNEEFDVRAHWDSTYERRGFTGVSWFQAEPLISLDLIAATGIPPDAATLDVGGGASTLVDRLLERGFADVSVLDISAAAIDESRRRLADASGVDWITHDVLSWNPSRQYQLWHDRAVFHFLASAADRDAYLRVVASALAPGGALVMGTFAADGPQTCSGLPVCRYSTQELAAALGDGFRPITARSELHRTPSGVAQPFTWIAARRVDE